MNPSQRPREKSDSRKRKRELGLSCKMKIKNCSLEMTVWKSLVITTRVVLVL